MLARILITTCFVPPSLIIYVHIYFAYFLNVAYFSNARFTFYANQMGHSLA
jgi:hypothetical protein